MSDKEKRIRITRVKSPIDHSERIKKILLALGLRRQYQSVEHWDTPSIRGMVDSVRFLLKVEEVQ